MNRSLFCLWALKTPNLRITNFLTHLKKKKMRFLRIFPLKSFLSNFSYRQLSGNLITESISTICSTDSLRIKCYILTHYRLKIIVSPTNALAFADCKNLTSPAIITCIKIKKGQRAITLDKKFQHLTVINFKVRLQIIIFLFRH